MPLVRSRLLLTVLTVVALAAGVTACQRPHQDPATVQRVVLVGDSLGHGAYAAPGIGSFLPSYYPNASILGVGGPATGPLDGFNRGAMTSDWSRQLQSILQSGYDADIVVIQGCCHNFSNEDWWRAAFDAVVAVARADDPGGDRRIIMATSPRIVPGTSPYFEASGIEPMIEGSNNVIRAYPDVAVADIDAAWSSNGVPLWNVPGVGVTHYVDGFHFSTLGANDAARQVADA